MSVAYTVPQRLVRKAVTHRSSVTAIDGKYPPLASDTSWAVNPGSFDRCRFITNLVVRGTTALADDPILTFRPYVRISEDRDTHVAACETVTYTRPRLQDLTSIKACFTTNIGVNFTDGSAAVIDNSSSGASNYMDVSSLDTIANGDYILIGGPCPFMGAAIDMNTTNSNAATLAVTYWNGAWTAVGNATDGTASGGATLGADGQVTWDLPTDWTAATVATVSGAAATGAPAGSHYWVRLGVSAALDATCTITEVDLLMPMRAGIDVQVDGDDCYLRVVSQDASVMGTVALSGSVAVSWR
jgi:hypothetical protein